MTDRVVAAIPDALDSFARASRSHDERLLGAAMALESALGRFGWDFGLVHDVRRHASAGHELSDAAATVAMRLRAADTGSWPSVGWPVPAVVLPDPEAVAQYFADSMKQMYRPTAVVGDGSTAAALEAEFRHGVRLSESGHYQKVIDLMRRFRKVVSSRHATEEIRSLSEQELGKLRAAKAFADEVARGRGGAAKMLSRFPRATPAQLAAAESMSPVAALATGIARVMSTLSTWLLIPMPASLVPERTRRESVA